MNINENHIVFGYFLVLCTVITLSVFYNLSAYGIAFCFSMMVIIVIVMKITGAGSGHAP
jgi:hypothetical protein